MIRLQTFGTLDLRGPHGELRSVLTQPKRLALLLRLASEPPGGFLRRDTLLAMFWPELDAPGARNALRQALFHLRKELGDGVILNRGDEEIGLDQARIRADVMDFEAAAAAGDWPQALDLLHGEFAPALFVAEAAPFEEWLEARRREIRRRAVDGAGALVAEADRAGVPATAVRWARRAVELEPENEAAVRRLMELLLAAGDSGGAAQAYANLEVFLRREYDAAPSSATQDVRRRIPPAQAMPPAGLPDPTRHPILRASPAPIPGAAASDSRPTHMRRPPWALAAIALLAVLAAAGIWLGRRASASGSAPATLLIAPFRTPGSDPGLAALAVGLADLTASRVPGTLSMQPVDPDLGLLALAEAEASGAGTEVERLQAAARRTGAGVVLTGTLLREGPRLIVAPLLLNAASGKTTALAVLAIPADSLPWLADRIASALLATFSDADSLDAPALAPIPVRALQFYLQGRAAMREGRVEEAAAAFALALEVDSTFALAAREYAEALDWLGADPTGEAMRHAWRLREGLGGRDRAILVALAGRRFPAPTPVRERVEDWERALRLAPDRSRSWFGLGDALFHLGDAAGIPDAQPRARAAFDRSLELDSASAPALLHRIEMAAREGDLATVRRLAPRMEGPNVPGDAAQFVRWRAAVALGDSAGRRAMVAGFDTLSPLALYRIAGWAQLDGVGMADAGLALDALRRQPRTGTETDRLRYMAVAYESNRGRPLAGSVLNDAAGYGPELGNSVLYAGPRRIREAWVALRGATVDGTDSTARERDNTGLLAVWQGEAFDTAWASRYLHRLDAGRDPAGAGLACVVAARLRAPDAASRLRAAEEALDGVSTAAGVSQLPLALARCQELQGDRAAALRTLGRQSLDPTFGPVALTGILYEEGRLALLAQDRARALRAWRRFLALRTDPEPALVPQRDSIQRLVDSLAR